MRGWNNEEDSRCFVRCLCVHTDQQLLRPGLAPNSVVSSQSVPSLPPSLLLWSTCEYSEHQVSEAASSHTQTCMPSWPLFYFLFFGICFSGYDIQPNDTKCPSIQAIVMIPNLYQNRNLSLYFQAWTFHTCTPFIHKHM